MKHARTVAIWLTGLLSAGFLGAFIADELDPGAEGAGMLMGAAAFICARLWATEPPAKDTMPVLDLKGGHLR